VSGTYPSRPAGSNSRYEERRCGGAGRQVSQVIVINERHIIIRKTVRMIIPMIPRDEFDCGEKTRMNGLHGPGFRMCAGAQRGIEMAVTRNTYMHSCGVEKVSY
jgi:hypothetical protein